MAQDPGMPDIQIDRNGLYREDIFTDRKAGTIRRLVPVGADGNTDSARSVLYSGQTQLLTPTGVLPLGFEIEATSLQDAIDKFPAAVKEALEQAIEEAREYRREAAYAVLAVTRISSSRSPPGLASSTTNSGDSAGIATIPRCGRSIASKSARPKSAPRPPAPLLADNRPAPLTAKR